MAEKKEAKLKFYEGAKPGVAQKRKEANTKCETKKNSIQREVVFSHETYQNG